MAPRLSTRLEAAVRLLPVEAEVGGVTRAEAGAHLDRARAHQFPAPVTLPWLQQPSRTPVVIARERTTEIRSSVAGRLEEAGDLDQELRKGASAGHLPPRTTSEVSYMY